MSGYNLLYAMGDIDSDLISVNYKKLRHKKIVSCIAVAIMVLALCAFAYAGAEIVFNQDEESLSFTILNPSSDTEHEEMEITYLSEKYGYEIVENTGNYIKVSNESGTSGFIVEQSSQAEFDGGEIWTPDSSDLEALAFSVLVVEDLSALTVEDIFTHKMLYWTSENCIYNVTIIGKADGVAGELLKMIQSITP